MQNHPEDSNRAYSTKDATFYPNRKESLVRDSKVIKLLYQDNFGELHKFTATRYVVSK